MVSSFAAMSCQMRDFTTRSHHQCSMHSVSESGPISAFPLFTASQPITARSAERMLLPVAGLHLYRRLAPLDVSLLAPMKA